MVLLAFLIWKYGDWRAWLMAGLFLIAAYGRIYGGVHFPLDVVVGLGLGMATMWFCHRWSLSWPVARWQASEAWQQWWWRCVGMIVVIEDPDPDDCCPIGIEDVTTYYTSDDTSDPNGYGEDDRVYHTFMTNAAVAANAIHIGVPFNPNCEYN